MVEARVRRNQCRLKGLDRLRHVVEGHRRRVIRESLLEFGDIGGNAAQRRLDGGWRVVHLDARLHRSLGLRLEILGAAVPELRDVEHRVQHGRRAARTFLPAMTDGGRARVDAAGAQIVAGRAAKQLALGKTRLEKQLAAQFDLGGRDLVVFHLRRDRGSIDRLEDRRGVLLQIARGGRERE